MRLTLVQGQPFSPVDVPLTDTLYDCDLGTAGPSLNLAGLPKASLQDVFNVGGVLVTKPMPVMEVPVTGITPIGGMTAGAGLLAVFDGNLNDTSIHSAMSPAAVAGFAPQNSIGFGISSTLPVTRLIVTSPNDVGFDGNPVTKPWKLTCSPINDWSSGVAIAGGYCPPSDGTRPVEFEARFANGLPNNLFYWVCFYGSGTNNTHCRQVRPFQQLPIASRGIVTVGGQPVNAAAFGAVPAQAGIYRGTILIDPDNDGMMRSTLSYGLKRIMPIWNMTDRRWIEIVAGYDGEPSMGGFPATPGHYQFPMTPQPTANNGYAFSPAMGNPDISVTVVNGMADSTASVSYYQAVSENSAGAGGVPAGATALWAAVNEKNPADVVLPTDLLSPFGGWGGHNLDSDTTDDGMDVRSEYVAAPFYGAKRWRAILGARSALCVCSYREQNQRLTARFEC